MTDHDDHHRTPAEASEPSALELVLAECSYEQRDRLRAVISLLAVPTDEAQSRQTRIDAAVARVAARDAETAAVLAPPTHDSPLSPEAGALVDDWVEGRAETAGALSALLNNLHTPGDGRRDERIDAALLAIERDEAARSERLRLTPERTTHMPRRRLRLSDLGAVAAVLVVVASMAFPVLSSMRTNTWNTQSTANLQSASLATSLFAADNDALIPHVQRQRSGADRTASWWTVGDPTQSHSAHLFSLISRGYLPGERLNSPGNPDAPDYGPDPSAGDWADQAQVSYSYRMFASRPPRIVGLSRTVLLADRSPLVLQHHAGEDLDAGTNSRNLSGRGQHIALGDGAVTFLSSPYVNQTDNIWLPAPAEHAIPRGLPGLTLQVAPGDQFVGP